MKTDRLSQTDEEVGVVVYSDSSVLVIEDLNHIQNHMKWKSMEVNYGKKPKDTNGW